MATFRLIAAPQSTVWLGVEATLRKAFSFPVFLGALLVAGVFACARLNPPDPDTWWHIAVGEQILRVGIWPEADPLDN